MPSSPRFATFWAGPPMPALDQACLLSFVRRGFDVTVYSYEPVGGLPDGVAAGDAGEIADRSNLGAFLYAGKPNMSHFTDYFRYRLFSGTDRTWIDTDMVCLDGPFPAGSDTLLARETATNICGAIMRVGSGAEKLPELLRRTEALRGADLVWGATGPRLLTSVLGGESVVAEAHPPERFFPVHFDDFWKVLVPERAAECRALAANASTLHLWNNIVVKFGYWKDLAPPEGSFLWERLAADGTLGLFKETYPKAIVDQLLANWMSRRSGSELGAKALSKQILPSVWRSVEPRLRAFRQMRS